MAEVILTTEQKATIQVGIQLGFTLEEFLARHSGWPSDEVTRVWNVIAPEIQNTKLPPGHYWAVPGEWS